MKNQYMDRVPAPAVGLIVALVAFAIVAYSAPNVLGQSGAPAAGDNEGPVTPRVVVATGKGAFGTYEVVSSQDADGNPCVGVRATSEAHGTRLWEGCGAADVVNNQVGFVADARKKTTLYFGRVSDAADSAAFSDKGAKKKDAKALKGSDGKKYVLTEIGEYLPQAEVALSDVGGRALGRVDGAAVSGNPDDNTPVHAGR